MKASVQTKYEPPELLRLEEIEKPVPRNDQLLVKVTRTALQNAASIAGLMITTECLIADKPEEDKKMGGMPGGDMY